MTKGKEQKQLWADKVCFMNSLKGGVIFCAYTQAQAQICEKVGAKALVAIQPPQESADDDDEEEINMADPGAVCSIMDSVVLPVFGQVRIGHEIEAHIMQEICVDGIHEYFDMFEDDDEEEESDDDEEKGKGKGKEKGKGKDKKPKKDNVPEIPELYLPKKPFRVPFISPAANLGEALQRIAEGASLIHTRGGHHGNESNVAYAVSELRLINKEIKMVVNIKDKAKEIETYATRIKVPVGFVKQVANLGKLPVPLFGYGGVRNPSDAAFLKSSGCDGIIVGPRILNSLDAQRRAYGIILATQDPKNYKMLAGISNKLGVQQ